MTVFENTWKQITANPLLWVDYYNLSHWYLKVNQDFEVSHIYNRSKPMILFGFNELVTEWFNGLVVTESMVLDAEIRAKRMNPDCAFPTEMWMRVVNECNGRIPIAIEALPDGTWVPQNTPFAQVRNTVKGFGELVTWFEVILLKAFFPSACATRAKWMRMYLDQSGLPLHRFHDFGFRGHLDVISAYWGTKAWMLTLQGTDNVAATLWAPSSNPSSIAAEAHKVLEQFDDGDYAGAKFGIEQAHSHGQKILAIVIDTYDSWRFISQYMTPLAQYAKTLGVWLVFRPDSGDVVSQVIAMWQIKQLNRIDNVSFIIGEGMSFNRAMEYDHRLKLAGVDLSLVAYGIGGGFYKDLDRDYLGFSMKTAYSNGDARMKFAEPYKQSIPDIVRLARDVNGSMYVTYDTRVTNLLQAVWAYNPDGSITNNVDSYEVIRQRVLDANPIQNMIKFGSDVQEKIAFLRHKYGLDTQSAQSSVQVIPIPKDV